ncbi:MAG: selenocysteine-specific translation elongation factor [Bacteroidales bacterium]|nr:selenocysteine-specific translation elongation factor [Bacteroidales bacterium]
MSRHSIIGTAGHIDHGKTALIKALTDIDCDTHKEEKERGITINLGFSHLNLPGGESIGIVDVPGHKDFIKTMVAGAFGIDLVLLVIAADSGVMPQTIEHLNIIKMLGIKQGIVALTKIDLVDEEMVELAKQEVLELLSSEGLDGFPVIGVSSITGKGLDKLIDTIDNKVKNLPKKNTEGIFRMFIDRIFNVKGLGNVVTGSVLCGETETGKEVFLLPGIKKKIRIKNIERHGEQANKVYSGDRAALNIAGLKAQDYKRGMILASQQIEETSMFDATLTLFEINTQLKPWSNVIFLTGTFECTAKIHLLDKDILKKEETAIVQIHLNKSHVVVNNDKFIIRNSSNDITLGGGTIFDTNPLHHKRRTPQLISQLTEFVNASLNIDKVYYLIKIELRKERYPVFADEIAKKLNRPEENIIKECQNNQDNEVLVYLSAGKYILITSSADSDFKNVIVENLHSWHNKNPLSENGIDTKALIGKLSFSSNEAGKLYTENLLENIFEDGITKKVSNTWALKNHSINIDSKTKENLDWLENEMKRCGMEKPLMANIEEIALSKNINKDKLKMMLKYLENQNTLYFYEGDYIHSVNVDKARTLILNDLINKERGINEKDFRLLLNTTKKTAHMLLGIFLDEGIMTKETFYIHITEKGKNILN